MINDRLKGKNKINSSLNLEASGLPSVNFQDIGHIFLSMTWPRFLFVLFLIFILINIFFAALFLIGGPHINHAAPGSFVDAFSFSIQTISTIGYGDFSPSTIYANLLVTLESFVGIIFGAVITGFSFAKVARPNAKVLFSQNVIFTEFEGSPAVMLRLGNARVSKISEAHVRLIVMCNQTTSEGHSMRRLYDLKPIREMTPVFAMTWTVIHKIDSSSPLYNKDFEELAKEDTGLIVSITGHDDTFSQTVHASHTYNFDRFIAAKGFVNMMEVTGAGVRKLDYLKFHQVELN